MGTSVNSDKNWTIMPKKRSNYDLDDANVSLKQRKKQLRTDITILVLIILIILLLFLILFKRIEYLRSNEDYFIQSNETIIPNNIFDFIFGDNKDNSKDDKGKRSSIVKNNNISTTEGSEESHEEEQGHETHEDDDDDDDDADEYIILSNRDSTHTENMPFNELIVPGDSDTKKYAVEVKHKEAVKVYFSLDSVTPTNDPVLDIIKLDISVNGSNKYSGTLRNYINNHTEYNINSTLSTNTVEYVIKMYIDSSVTDNYSNNTDGNYQGKNVNFSLKWWIENEND